MLAGRRAVPAERGGPAGWAGGVGRRGGPAGWAGGAAHFAGNSLWAGSPTSIWAHACLPGAGSGRSAAASAPWSHALTRLARPWPGWPSCRSAGLAVLPGRRGSHWSDGVPRLPACRAAGSPFGWARPFPSGSLVSQPVSPSARQPVSPSARQHKGIRAGHWQDVPLQQGRARLTGCAGPRLAPG